MTIEIGLKSEGPMLMNPIGGIIMTNDGNAILREITVQHPAAKSMIEISRTQDEEVGDGTTSVIILVDVNNPEQMTEIIKSCIGTKFINKWSDLACKIAIDAVKTVCIEDGGHKEIDIKRYAKVEKVPGGAIEDSCVLRGVMLNKDVTHPRMKRRIEKPRIVLLDCNLEYKKGESQTNIEISREEDFTKILEIEEQYIQQICSDIIKLKPDVVITEKGVSDLAQHYLMKANISCVRRVRKTDNNRIARVCGATIANRTDELREEDVGTKAGLFEIKKIGEEYYCFITECEDPKACTILLRGASKDVLQEVERNLQDAMCVARNVILEPRLVPGGGAVEMAVGHLLTEKSKNLTGVQQWPYRALAKALEIIPATLIQNCGGNTIRTLTALKFRRFTRPTPERGFMRHDAVLSREWRQGTADDARCPADALPVELCHLAAESSSSPRPYDDLCAAVLACYGQTFRPLPGSREFQISPPSQGAVPTGPQPSLDQDLTSPATTPPDLMSGHHALIPAPDHPPDEVQEVLAAIGHSTESSVFSTASSHGPSDVPAICTSSLTSMAHNTSATSGSTTATSPHALESAIDGDIVTPTIRPPIAEASPAMDVRRTRFFHRPPALCASCQQRPALALRSLSQPKSQPLTHRWPNFRDAATMTDAPEDDVPGQHTPELTAYATPATEADIQHADLRTSP
ncbi:hypothetical protein HPB52_020899 [Rhipicephalus sanguineus]|uniref:T-complex protein 1 subunit gamma n=1 Tax=Rhipicephalus sanguineus TaxID=34632 RepID=A0A9D4Q2Q1_RHISA|nr:hypothetical protein HPB52_020899 [Rhipicephalus sanguineus]